MTVFLSSSLKDSAGNTRWFPLHALPEKHGLPHFNIVPTAIWMTISDSDNSVQTLTGTAASACRCQEPPWNSSQGLFVQLFCLRGPFLEAVRNGREWANGGRHWQRETGRGEEERRNEGGKTPIHILLFAMGNQAVSNHKHRGDYRLAAPAVPYLDNACQMVPWNTISLHGELHHRGWYLSGVFFLMSNKCLERQWAWGLLGDLSGSLCAPCCYQVHEQRRCEAENPTTREQLSDTVWLKSCTF